MATLLVRPICCSALSCLQWFHTTCAPTRTRCLVAPCLAILFALVCGLFGFPVGLGALGRLGRISARRLLKPSLQCGDGTVSTRMLCVGVGVGG